MKMSFKLLVSSFLLIGLMTSCVSSKKYKTLQSEYDTMQSMNKAKMDAANAELKDCNTNTASLKTEVGDLKRAVTTAEGNTAEARKMEAAKQKEIAHIKAEIKAAFAGLGTEGLTFNEKNGNLYISVAPQVLYRRGRAELNKSGGDVVARLAEAFKSNADMRIIVEGHTDSDRIRKTRYLYKDNWDLSVARASNVVRALIGAGVGANQLTAAGRANTTPLGMEGKDGKAMERRIEFILMPDGGRLYKLAK